MSIMLKEKGDTLSSVHFYDSLSFSPSGGTLATSHHVLSNRYIVVSFFSRQYLLFKIISIQTQISKRIRIRSFIKVSFRREIQ
jgi:hypothetical protein